MRTESLPVPPIPDLAIVADVIRLADACEAERYAHRPPEYSMYAADDLERYLQPRPRWYALVDCLRSLPEETVAALYAIYRAGDLPCSSAREAAKRYRYSYDLAMQPMHRRHGATDLAAKGPLADGLRRGLANLRLDFDRTVPRSGNNLHPAIYLEG